MPDSETECKAALNIAGEHYPCDQPFTDDGTHGGFAHGNREAQAIWCSHAEAADPHREQVAMTRSTRQEVLTVLVLILLTITIALQVRGLIADHQPFTQYCDWVQPGKVLTCHR